MTSTNKRRESYTRSLSQNMVQQYACARHMQDHLDRLAALYPDCDVRIGEHDEVFLVAKNENPDLKAIGERVHAAAEGMFDAISAQEQRELQRWQGYAAGWKEGVQGLLDFAQDAHTQAVHDFYVCPPARPHLVKTKKGPRRYRVQMVRQYYSEDFCTAALAGIPARIHQITKMPGFTS